MDAPGCINENLAGPRDIRPLRDVLSFRREKLEATVLAVGHVHHSLFVHGDAVRHAELTGAHSGCAPRKKEPARRIKFVDARIAVAIGDIHFATGRQGDVGWKMEWRACVADGPEIDAGGARVRWHARRPERHEQPSFGREFADGVAEVIGAIDRVIRPDEKSVRPGEETFAPRRLKGAIAIKNIQRMIVPKPRLSSTVAP